jgi:septum formation protein
MNLNSLLHLNGKKLILASGSPRRSSLLSLVGFNFEIITSDINEDDEKYTIPEVYVLELSQKKAARVAEKINDGFIVGADTIVVLDDKILGKPRNAKHAKKMLQTLSGRTHTVVTGFSIIEKPSGRVVNEYEKTDVTFRELSEDEIDAYVKTKSSLDKAGAYGIQDHGAVFVSRVNGCFYNVMGFPISRFYASFQSFIQMFN